MVSFPPRGMAFREFATRFRSVCSSRATRRLFAFSILYLFALFATLLLEVVARAMAPLIW